MSLANVAWILAARGLRVLVVDWDLEAPGVHRYFHPFLEDPLQRTTEGLIDGLWAYVSAVPSGAAKQAAEHARLQDYTQSLTLPFSSGGNIDFLGCGRQDSDYTRKVGGFDWMTFYARLNGKAFIDGFGKWARESYDHVLIDSRTGVSDTAGICTVQLPDTVALFFVYNRQSIEGTAAAARTAKAQRQKRPLRIIACPSRVEDRQLATPARKHAALCFEDILEDRPPVIERRLRAHEILHFSWCSYEEKLAVFEEEPEESGTLLQAMEALASRIAPDKGQNTEYPPREVLNSLWRRAAFRDPRLDEIETLRSGSLAQRISQLKLWLGETLDETTDNNRWPSALARECAAVAVAAFGVAPTEDLEQLGEGAIKLARRLRRTGETDPAVLMEVHRSRAVQLRRDARFEEAYDVVSQGLQLEGATESPAARQSLFRSLELRAELAKLMKGAEAALPDLTRLVEEQEATGLRRDPRLPLGRARAHRLLAETLLEAGRSEDALHEANVAVKIARAFTDDAAYAELGAAMLIHARAALSMGHPDGEKLVRRTKSWIAGSDLPESTKLEMQLRLSVAWAAYYRENGDYESAVQVLDSVSGDLPAWAAADLAEAKAKISLARDKDAPHVSINDSRSVSPDDLKRFLHNAIAQTRGDPAARDRLFRNFVERMLDHTTGDEDPLTILMERIPPEFRSDMMRALRSILSQGTSTTNRTTP